MKHLGGPSARFCLSSSTKRRASRYSALAFLNWSRATKFARLSVASCRLPNSEKRRKRSPFWTVPSVSAD